VSNEDAFRYVRSCGGICICVSKSAVNPESTEAQYWLQGTDEVTEFVELLANLSRGDDYVCEGFHEAEEQRRLSTGN